MVGTLQQRKDIYALVKAPDNNLFRVKPGNYLGQNFGRIIGISESDIKLKEIVQDKVEAARRFAVGRRTVYRYLAAAKAGTLAPKTSWGRWRTLDPQKLQAHVKKHPDATLQELATALAVSHNAVWVRLGQLGLTLKKTHQIPRTQRGAALALPARTRKVQRPARLLPRRVRRGSPPVS
jgi:transposase